MIYYGFHKILYALELYMCSELDVFQKCCVVQYSAVQCSSCGTSTLRTLYSTVIVRLRCADQCTVQYSILIRL